ncbi:hypothetical protein, partial [Teichococcus cervicalis]|uniref:hypothetical protein n=1 Tax=Teichococcus cervicalis TaxID=204525 RepID=UPI000590F337
MAGAEKDPPHDAGPGTPPGAEGLETLAEDWITLWQSEITAWAADRELAEAWSSWAALGAAWLRAASTPPPSRAFAPSPFPPGFGQAPFA